MNKIICISNCCLFSIDFNVLCTLIIVISIIAIAFVLPKILKIIYEFKTMEFKLIQKETEEKKDMLKAKEKYEGLKDGYEKLQKREAILRYLIDSTENHDKVEEYKNELQNLYK